MLQPSSRYSVSYEVRNGDTTIVGNRIKTTTPSFLTHTSRDGESMDILSARYLGSPLFYWRIADLNPHIPYPDRIPAGTKVRIPQ